MEIKDNQVIIYIDDKPIACTSSVNLTIDDPAPVLCTAVPEWNLKVSGKWPKLTRLQALDFEWHCSRRMPRKKKKAYRKKLRKAIVYELYREKVNEFLSTI